MILGLDLSTSISGATILDSNGKMIYNESWDLRNKKTFPDLFSKIDGVKNKIDQLFNTYGKPDKIYIEKTLQAFRPGFSSAKILSMLVQFNGIVSYICYDQYKKMPEYIAAFTSRKACGIKVPRGENAKEVVLKYVLDNEPSFVIEYTKFGNPKAGTYDKSDSYVIAKAGWIKEKS
jgi:Holliday junction resolvasome RuvABC endonuclease subunit